MSDDCRLHVPCDGTKLKTAGAGLAGRSRGQLAAQADRDLLVPKTSNEFQARADEAEDLDV